MKPTLFAMKTTLLATLIISGKTFAQSLPDEINHPQYLRIYQNLEQVLTDKTTEFNHLSAQKAEIEKKIAEMEQDQVALPARNSELQRLIDSKRQELGRIETDLIGLEGILNKVIEDLRKIDAMIAQLQRDLSDEGTRSQAITSRRAQIAQDVARISTKLQQEIADEQQSVGILNNLNRQMNRDLQKKNEQLVERQNLIRDVERFKREVPAQKNKLTANTQAVNLKKAQLSDVQLKLPALKSQISTSEASLSRADSEIAPNKAKLTDLRAELARQMPEVAKLQKEISDLNSKIESNKLKISSSGLDALKAKRDALEKDLSSVNTQIQSLNGQIVAAKEAIKPDIGQLNDVRAKIRDLERSGANPTELARLKNEADAIERRIAPKRIEIVRMEKQYETLLLSVAPRNQELANLKDQVTKKEAEVASLLAENQAAREKVAENQKIIDERLTTNSDLVKQINELDAFLKNLEVNRDKIAKELAQLKYQESALNTQISSLTKEIQTIEAESVQIAKTVAQMEKVITDAPLEIRRLDNHMQKLDDQIQAARIQIIREDKLLVRIQQNRALVERDLGLAQAELNRVNNDLSQSNQLISMIQGKLQQENQNRDSLTRYNQDSIRKYDGLKIQKVTTQQVVSDSLKEIGFNDQDIRTIADQLPRLRTELNLVIPKVASAERSMQEAQKKSDEAGVQYQNRMSLFQKYLAEAQRLGLERASIGTTDGTKAGALEARTKAIKLASESAASEAKWVALRRGYIRGEVAGYQSGFDIGLSSSQDAVQGDNDGRIAGIKRAKDQANLVLKPEFYLEELNRRLMEDDVQLRKNLAIQLSDQVSTVSSAKIALINNVPELTQDEIDASSRILSSLDALIEQALIESTQVVALRSRLANAQGVYTTPGAGENASNPNCSGTYKNVKEFIDACKTSYGSRYQGLFASAHQDSFAQEYGRTFTDQVLKTFNLELDRLYPGFLKEASTVGRDVGLAAGKKEIYNQSFARAENASYSANIATEEARVELEAIAMVEEYLKGNAALTLKGEAKLKGDAAYGIAPGVDVELKMLIKNIGSKASLGNSLIKVKEVSPQLVMSSREAAIAAVAPKSQAELSVMKMKVSDTAVPGSRLVVAGEIVHPGNDYRAARVENFRLETVVVVNPSVESEMVFDTTPKVATLGILRKHDIDYAIRPKFEGVDQGYEVVIEEVGSSFARFSNTRVATEKLDRGTLKKMTFEYKLDKAARGKSISFKITVKNGSNVVKTSELQVKAQ